MRFFSNDAKETTETDTERPDDAGVPQQRVGSPWSDTNPVAGEHTGAEDHDDHDLGGPKAETDTHDSDVDLPLDERDTFENANVDESTVTSPDAAVNEPTDAAVAGSDRDPALRDEDSTPRDDSVSEESLPEDSALRDEGDFDEPTAVDPVTEKPLDERDDSGVDTTSAVDATSDVDATEAAVVDRDDESTTYAGSSTTDETVPDEDPTPADTSDTAPVVAAVPVPAGADTVAETPAAETPAAETPVADAKPGTVEEKSVEAIFGADDAAAFKDRWRDVQLRFVDSPKDATAEAAGLVDEAVDKLTASLKSQKDGLLSDSDDTEKLRVELRGYREILNKVLGL